MKTGTVAFVTFPVRDAPRRIATPPGRRSDGRVRSRACLFFGFEKYVDCRLFIRRLHITKLPRSCLIYPIHATWTPVIRDTRNGFHWRTHFGHEVCNVCALPHVFEGKQAILSHYCVFSAVPLPKPRCGWRVRDRARAHPRSPQYFRHSNPTT